MDDCFGVAIRKRGAEALEDSDQLGFDGGVGLHVGEVEHRLELRVDALRRRCECSTSDARTLAKDDQRASAPLLRSRLLWNEGGGACARSRLARLIRAANRGVRAFVTLGTLLQRRQSKGMASRRSERASLQVFSWARLGSNAHRGVRMIDRVHKLGDPDRPFSPMDPGHLRDAADGAEEAQKMLDHYS